MITTDTSDDQELGSIPQDETPASHPNDFWKEITSLARTLPQSQQTQLLDLARGLVQDHQNKLTDQKRQAELQKIVGGDGEDESSSHKNTELPGAKGGSWFEIKTIKGHKYRYRRWREGKKTRSEYVGKVQEH